jgi:hypothetical protein
MLIRTGYAICLAAALSLAVVSPVLAQGKDVNSRPKVSCSPVEHLTAWIKSVAGKNTCKTEANVTYRSGSGSSAKSVATNKKS